MTTFSELFHKHVASSFDKQLRLGEATDGDDQDCQCDVQAGKITFTFTRKGSGFFAKKNKFEVAYDVQILGSEANGLNTWLWIWANEGASYPKSVMQAASRLHQLGERESIAEFTEGEISLESISGENIALIASGECEAFGYVPLPYAGGCAYMLIYSSDKQEPVDNPLPRILTVFPQALSALEISNHKLAFMGYLSFYSVQYTDSGDTLEANHPWGTISAKFDNLNRLIDLSAKMAAPAQK